MTTLKITQADYNHIRSFGYTVEALMSNYHKYHTLSSPDQRVIDILRPLKLVWKLDNDGRWQHVAYPCTDSPHTNNRYRVDNSFTLDSLEVEPSEPEYFDCPVDTRVNSYMCPFSNVELYVWEQGVTDTNFLGIKYKEDPSLHSYRVFVNGNNLVFTVNLPESKGIRPATPEFIRFYNPKFKPEQKLW